MPEESLAFHSINLAFFLDIQLEDEERQYKEFKARFGNELKI